ncbi:MAG: patatin-like phospholipase family protein [Methyloligellaceae bacterium]
MAVNNPEFGLALGGGGARGLAHIHVLEVLDELGIKPKIISGTSIGAIFGAAYAAGLSGKEIREFSMEAMGKRIRIFKNLFGHSPKTLFQLWNVKELSKSLLSPEMLLEKLFPDELQTDFDKLKIPMKVVATAYYTHNQVVLDKGPVLPAVAASMALPVVFRPVMIDDVLLVDGGLANPVPFDVLQDDIKQVVAIDVTGGPVWDGQTKMPSMAEVLYAAAQIPQNTIIQEKMKQYKPTIFLRAPVQNYPSLAFHKIKEILEKTEDFRDLVKREIEEKLEATPIQLGYTRN